MYGNRPCTATWKSFTRNRGVNVTTVNSIWVKSCRRRLTLFLCHSRWRLPGDYAAREMLRRDTASFVNSIGHDNRIHIILYRLTYFRTSVRNIEFQKHRISVFHSRPILFRLLESHRNYVLRLQFIGLINTRYPHEETNPSSLLARERLPAIMEIAMSINLNYSRVYINYYNFDVDYYNHDVQLIRNRRR